MEKRSKKAFKNVTSGLLNKFVLLVFAFSTRTIFSRLLGAEYLGISSLYKNILSVLSLAELGIGNVFMFYLYPALKEKNEDEICGLVYEFRKIYFGIIIFISVIGLSLIPFLKYIVHGNYSSIEVVLYYCLYLFNSIASYLVIYRTMVLSADQKTYIQSRCFSFTTLLMYVLQIIYLLIRKDFLGYLIIQVSCTFLYNFILNFIAIQKYPFLKKIKRPSSTENRIDKMKLIKDMKATFLFKISDVILDQTDNIIISVMFGTVMVGFYSNYFMVISYLVDIIGIIAVGLVASFGNLNVEGDKQKMHRFFRATMTLFAFAGTFCTACYACVIQDFIPIWIGSDYLMDYKVIIAILVVFFLRMITNTIWIYRSAMGIFKEVQYINLFAAGLNIILSIILGKLIGVSGVIVATAISRLMTSFWYEGKVVFNKLNRSPFEYYFKQIKDIIIAIFVVAITFSLTYNFHLVGLNNIVIKIIICGMVTLTIEYIIYHKSDEFYIFKEKFKVVLKKKNK